MPDIMLKIGSFSFNASEATYQSLEQCFNFDWVATKRLGGSPSYQYIGEGERSLNLSGTIYIRQLIASFYFRKI